MINVFQSELIKEDNKTFYDLTFEFINGFGILEYILFKNYYSEMLSIYAFDKYNSFCILSNYKLMEFPDCEEEAEKIIFINKNKLNLENINIEEVIKLRFIFSQSCKDYVSYKINNILLFSLIDTNTNSNSQENKIFLNQKQILVNKEEIIDMYISLLKEKNINNDFKLLI